MRVMSPTSNARRLRKSPTDAERALWGLLRNRRLLGHKFRRQTPIGRYVADFVCFERKLIIEVDGGHHLQQTQYDEHRAKWLESKGFRVLRFWNNQVLTEPVSVQEAIMTELDMRKVSSTIPGNK